MDYTCKSPRRVYHIPNTSSRTLGALRYKEAVEATGETYSDDRDFIFIQIKFGSSFGWVVFSNKQTEEEYFDVRPSGVL